MSLFDLSKELRNDIMNVGVAIDKTREEARKYSLILSSKIDVLDDVFTYNEKESRRSIIDFIDTSIEDLLERKKELESKTLNELIDGEEVHGFELKEGRITRSIAAKDQSKAVNTMTEYVDKDAMYDTKMIGIPAIEKLLKEQGMKKSQVDAVTSQFITVKTGKPTLARTKI